MTTVPRLAGQGRDRDALSRMPYLANAALRDAHTVAAMARQARHVRVAAERLLEPFRRVAAHLRAPHEDLAPGKVRHDVLVEAATWRICVLTLGPKARIPLHDHPDSYALNLGLSGSARAFSYALLPGTLDDRACLLARSVSRLGSGDTALLDPWEVNLHSLHAGQEGARLLSGRFAIGTTIEPSNLYFPGRADRDGLLSAEIVDRARLDALGVLCHSRAGAGRSSGALQATPRQSGICAGALLDLS